MTLTILDFPDRGAPFKMTTWPESISLRNESSSLLKMNTLVLTRYPQSRSKWWRCQAADVTVFPEHLRWRRKGRGSKYYSLTSLRSTLRLWKLSHHREDLLSTINSRDMNIVLIEVSV